MRKMALIAVGLISFLTLTGMVRAGVTVGPGPEPAPYPPGYYDNGFYYGTWYGPGYYHGYYYGSYDEWNRWHGREYGNHWRYRHHEHRHR